MNPLQALADIRRPLTAANAILNIQWLKWMLNHEHDYTEITFFGSPRQIFACECGDEREVEYPVSSLRLWNNASDDYNAGALAGLADGEIKGPFVFDQIEQAPWR